MVPSGMGVTTTAAGGLLDVVARGEAWAVIDKPVGLHSVPGRTPDKQDSVESRARVVFPDATGPLIVHRLDSETSGLMVLGLTRRAHSRLSRQFMHRKVGKSYAALVRGVPALERGSVDLPLAFDAARPPRQKVCFREGRHARTLYRTVGREAIGGEPATRLDVRTLTGRTHQIRVHAATPRCAGGPIDEPFEGRCGWPVRGGVGCPILGDTLYGDPGSAPRLMLHARFLAFWEPFGDRWIKVERAAPF